MRGVLPRVASARNLPLASHGRKVAVRPPAATTRLPQAPLVAKRLIDKRPTPPTFIVSTGPPLSWTVNIALKSTISTGTGLAVLDAQGPPGSLL